eukprot:m.213331 g.213331  ORF g.213331 m.213331 type:complete len:295 (-) comp25558_c0_seq1:89-973(-)
MAVGGEARGIHPYTDPQTSATVEVGTIYTVVEEGDGWTHVEHPAGTDRGWVPSTYLEVVGACSGAGASTATSDDGDPIDGLPPPPPPVTDATDEGDGGQVEHGAPPPSPGWVDDDVDDHDEADGVAQVLGTAVYDWEAKEPDQITFTEGETIVVLDQHESGWWWGRTSRQGEGCFPGNYIVIEAEASGGEPDATPVDELLGPEPEPISGTHRTGSLVSNLETPLPPSPPCGDSATDAAVQARGAPHRWSTPAESDPTAAAAVHASRQHTPTATPRKSTPAPAHPTDAKRLLFAT